MPTSEEPALTRPALILLVETNCMDVELTLDVFREARLTNAVQVARTCPDALDYLLGRGEFADRERYPLPDLVLLDLKISLAGNGRLLREIKSKSRLKDIPVVILTSSKDVGDRALRQDLVANGYLVRPVQFGDVLAIVGKIKDCSFTLNVHPPLDASPHETLSARERQVLEFLVEGKSRLAIARALFLSPKTVETYRARIMQKLDIRTIPQLVKFAIQQGLTSIE
jgi:DNA-binding NarL/FixJ family response regulator